MFCKFIKATIYSRCIRACGIAASLKLKLNKGNVNAVQGDTGHTEARMVTDTYVHGFDADRKLIARKVEFAQTGTIRKIQHPLFYR